MECRYKFLDTLNDVEDSVNGGHIVDAYRPDPLTGCFVGVVCGIDWEINHIFVKIPDDNGILECSPEDDGSNFDIISVPINSEEYSFCENLLPSEEN